jgi:hypothetical protein
MWRSVALALLLIAGGAGLIWQFAHIAGGAMLILLGVSMLVFRVSLKMLAVQILAPLLAAVLAAFSYNYVAGSPLLDSVRLALAQDSSQLGLVLELFNGTTSTIYALLVAFMVFNAMQDHNDINSSLEKEAMHLDSISQLLPLLHDSSSTNRPVVIRLHGLLERYADNVLSKSFTRAGYLSENQAVIDEAFEQVYSIRLEDDNDRIALAALMRRVDELESLRAHRVSAMKSHPSPFLLILLFVLSIVVVAPYYLPVPGGETLAPYAVGVITFCTVFLLVMLFDMASHFNGYWTVDREPFKTARDRIAARMQRLHTPPRAAAA